MTKSIRIQTVARALPALLVLLLPGLNGCVSTDGGVDAEDSANVRIVHLAAESSGIEVWVDGNEMVTGELDYMESSDCVELGVGLRVFSVVSPGADPQVGGLVTEDLALQRGRSYTLFLHGPPSDLTLIGLTDDTVGIGEDMVRVRALHMAPGAVDVDLWNIPDGGGSSIIYRDLAYPGVGGSRDLPAVAYQLGLDLDDDAVMEDVFELPDLPAGHLTYLMFSTDGAGEAFFLVLSGDDPALRVDPKQL